MAHWNTIGDADINALSQFDRINEVDSDDAMMDPGDFFSNSQPSSQLSFPSTFSQLFDDAASNSGMGMGMKGEEMAAFMDAVAYLFEPASTKFPDHLQFSGMYGDAAYILSDRHAHQEQLIQITEPARRKFDFLGDDKFGNIVFSPRRGVHVHTRHFLKMMSRSGFLIIDVRSPVETKAVHFTNSIEFPVYWSLEDVLDLLWDSRTMTPRHPANTAILIIGEQSDLRATGLYLSILRVSQMIFLSRPKKSTTLDYPEMYIIHGGFRAVLESINAFTPYLTFQPGSSFVSQFAVDDLSLIEAKHAYYSSASLPRRYDARLHLQVFRNPLQVSAEVSELVEYYTTKHEEYRSIVESRRENPLLANSNKQQRLGEEI